MKTALKERWTAPQGLTESLGDSAMDNSTCTSIYRYYDRVDTLLYVGITSQRSARNQQHNADKAWWPYVVRQDVEHFGTRAEALAREKSLIQARRPPFNIQHNPDRGELGPAYVAYAESVKQGPGKLMAALRGRLPLLRVGSRGTLTIYRTDPEHMALASRTFPIDGLFLSYRGRRTRGVRVAHVPSGDLEVAVDAEWLDGLSLALVVTRQGQGYAARKFDVSGGGRSCVLPAPEGRPGRGHSMNTKAPNHNGRE